jgi:transposase InsO family protein
LQWDRDSRDFQLYVIVACDFCVVVTATFRLLYVFVVMEHTTRRIPHANVTAHPTASWTLQQLRDAMPSDHGYRFLIHDRDSISLQLDQQVCHLGLRVLKTPPQSPQANAICERLIGTLRRECLDFLIPLTEHHLRHLHSFLCRHKHTGTAFQSTCAAWPVRLLVAFITNTSLRRRPRDGGIIVFADHRHHNIENKKIKRLAI